MRRPYYNLTYSSTQVTDKHEATGANAIVVVQQR